MTLPERVAEALAHKSIKNELDAGRHSADYQNGIADCHARTAKLTALMPDLSHFVELYAQGRCDCKYCPVCDAQSLLARIEQAVDSAK